MLHPGQVLRGRLPLLSPVLHYIPKKNTKTEKSKVILPKQLRNGKEIRKRTNQITNRERKEEINKETNCKPIRGVSVVKQHNLV
jgi:hypothetical protein